MSAREEAIKIIASLPEGEVVEFLAYLKQRQLKADPLLQALAAAPEDEEPSSPEEEAALSEAREQALRGEVVSWDDTWKQLGHG